MISFLTTRRERRPGVAPWARAALAESSPEEIRE